MNNFLTKNRNKQVITTSSQETFIIGKKIGKSCIGSEVILLLGDLGAGKTVLAQGIASGLGCKDKVNSPTFNILKIYDIKSEKPQKIRIFCHVDAYRLNTGKDLLSLGIEEFMDSPDTVTVIEWAEKVKSVWPHDSIKIQMRALSEDQREIKIS